MEATTIALDFLETQWQLGRICYTAIVKLFLSSFSFGKCCAGDREKIRVEDLARSALVTTCNNIGSIALNVAISHGIERIVFVGKCTNYLGGHKCIRVKKIFKMEALPRP
jgi:pantothenate kinase